MPRLDKKTQHAVAKADAVAGFEVLPEGMYLAQLNSVEERPGQQYPYWVWEFTELTDKDGKTYPGRLWNNTSLSPKSAGFLKATFEAFGVTPDTDTDDLVGQQVCLFVIQETVMKGARIGQLRNAVKYVAPVDEELFQKALKTTADPVIDEDEDGDEEDDWSDTTPQTPRKRARPARKVKPKAKPKPEPEDLDDDEFEEDEFDED